MPFAVIRGDEFGDGVLYIVHHFLNRAIGVMTAGGGQVVVDVEVVHEFPEGFGLKNGSRVGD